MQLENRPRLKSGLTLTDEYYQTLMRALIDKYILELHREGKTAQEIAASFDNRLIRHPSQECNFIRSIIAKTLERERLEARWRQEAQKAKSQ